MMLLSTGDAEQVFAQGLTRRKPIAGIEYFVYESYSFGLHARFADLCCPSLLIVSHELCKRLGGFDEHAS